MTEERAETIPAAVRPAFDAIVNRVDAVCREYLNDEYVGLGTGWLSRWPESAPRRWHAASPKSGPAASSTPSATGSPRLIHSQMKLCGSLVRATKHGRNTLPGQPRGDRIVGLTPIGRATVVALNLNRPSLVKARQAWGAARDI